MGCCMSKSNKIVPIMESNNLINKELPNNSIQPEIQSDIKPKSTAIINSPVIDSKSDPNSDSKKKSDNDLYKNEQDERRRNAFRLSKRRSDVISGRDDNSSDYTSTKMDMIFNAGSIDFTTSELKHIYMLHNTNTDKNKIGRLDMMNILIDSIINCNYIDKNTNTKYKMREILSNCWKIIVNDEKSAIDIQKRLSSPRSLSKKTDPNININTQSERLLTPRPLTPRPLTPLPLSPRIPTTIPIHLIDIDKANNDASRPLSPRLSLGLSPINSNDNRRSMILNRSNHFGDSLMPNNITDNYNLNYFEQLARMVETPRRYVVKEDTSNNDDNINTDHNNTLRDQISMNVNTGNNTEQKLDNLVGSPYLILNNMFYEVINKDLPKPITNIRIQAELFKNMIEIMITTDRSKFKKVLFRFRRMIKKKIIDNKIFNRLKSAIITAMKNQLKSRWTDIMEDVWGQMCDKVLLFIRKKSNLDK